MNLEKEEPQKKQKLPIKEEILIPISIFNNPSLSALETVVKFLKENKNIRGVDIAKLLKRNDKTIYTTYNKTSKKLFEQFPEQLIAESEFFIPVSAIADRTSAPLEALVKFLKDKLNLRFVVIAKLLNRDPRTVWTVYNRKKNQKNKTKNADN
ncbi:hypothetical protein ACFL0W_06615 [Nanoarchaeota archaeon]